MKARKNIALLGVIGVSILTLVGCGNAPSANGSSPTSATKSHTGTNNNKVPSLTNTTKNAAKQSGASNSTITLYQNPDFIVQSKSKQYTSYFDGMVNVETSNQLSQEETGGHSPWKTSPIYVAVYGTQNFAPNSDGIKQISETSKLFTGTYNGTNVTYSLVSSTQNTAKVVEAGLPYSLIVELYKPLDHHYWLIDKIQLYS